MITSMKDLLAMIIYLVSCVGVNRLPWLDGVVNTQKVWQDGYYFSRRGPSQSARTVR